MSNSDEYISSILGVHMTAFDKDEKIEFNCQTILDNVKILDEETLQEINQVIVEAGYSIHKKKRQKNSG